MQSNRTLVVAIMHCERVTIAEEMNCLLGEWLEGCYDEIGSDTCSLAAQLQFKACWSLLNKECKQAVLDACVFEKFANEWAEKEGLEKPYAPDGLTKYGTQAWKRVRENPVGQKVVDEWVEYLDHTLWKKARNYRRQLEENAKA